MVVRRETRNNFLVSAHNKYCYYEAIIRKSEQNNYKRRRIEIFALPQEAKVLQLMSAISYGI